MEREMLAKLNEYQRQAVLDDSTACLVNAHVGSGKTTVLITKIFYLHKVKQVDFRDMVVLTFTNKAANEIKERISQVDPLISDEHMPYFGTFHSVALRMLKDILPVEILGYTKDFSVIDTDEEAELATRLLTANRLNIKYRNKLYKRLEQAEKGKCIYGVMKHEDDIKILMQLLKEEKIAQNKMNFDDLIHNAQAILSDQIYTPRWVIVDEFQDSDGRQLEFIKKLITANTKIFAVGDPNQIIYSWRGSEQDVFSTFKSEYHARELSLPINYRSCNTILEVAKCFLDDKSDLSGLREQGNKIRIKNHYNPFNEAQYLLDKIREITANGTEYKEIAIFYRLQKQSKTLQDVLDRAQVPYEVSMRKTLKDVPVLCWFIRLLRCSINVNDIDSEIYVIKHNVYGDKECGKNIEESSLYHKMKNFGEWCRMSAGVQGAYEYFKIDEYINPTSASYAEDKKQIIMLLKKIEEYIKLRNGSLWEGMKSFIDSSALYGVDILKEDVHLESNSVKLMTLHASKGLEFKYVFIIGVNFGLLPLRGMTMEEQEEERRLFFVGITRAKDDLELSYYTSPDDAKVMSGPSSYLTMIPYRLVEREEKRKEFVGLQALRKEVAETMERQNSDICLEVEEKEVMQEVVKERKVKHAKYGIGNVLSETEDTITVIFEGYGEKEFLKMFSEVEEV